MWFVGVEVEQETSAPPPKKNPVSAPAFYVFDISGGSRPSDKGGGGRPQKNFFRSFGPHFDLKISGGPGPLPWICHCYRQT